MENVAYFTPPAIEGYGKRRIFHALDNLNTIRDDKTAHQQRRACRFPRARRVFSATKTSFYRISQSQITHLKTRIKTSAPYLAGDPRFFSILLGKKQLPPLCTTQAGWQGRGWAGFEGLVGW